MWRRIVVLGLFLVACGGERDADDPSKVKEPWLRRRAALDFSCSSDALVVSDEPSRRTAVVHGCGMHATYDWVCDRPRTQKKPCDWIPRGPVQRDP